MARRSARLAKGSRSSRFERLPCSCTVCCAVSQSPRIFFCARARYVRFFDSPATARTVCTLEEQEVGKDMVPKRIFLTKGVGKHKERLTSFELALRDAGIA